MPDLIISNVDPGLFQQLEVRAAQHQRAPADEARAILSETPHTNGGGSWAAANEILRHLADSGCQFSDSAELLREDRDR